MALGERLRLARQEAGLSQRQLCGDYMTRNMLSQIENGSAKPSMDTLRYLAEQLGKSVSYFLEEQVQLSENQPAMEQAEEAARRRDWEGVRRSLEQYKAPDPLFDDRRALLGALAAMALAQEAESGKRHLYARQLLAEALGWEKEMAFPVPGLHRELTLLQGMLAQEKAGQLAALLPRDDRELLLRARAALEAGENTRCVALVSAAWEPQSFEALLLRGQAAMAMGDHAAARVCYQAIEDRAPELAWPALEQCCLALEDYKQAYYYACKQRGD